MKTNAPLQSVVSRVRQPSAPNWSFSGTLLVSPSDFNLNGNVRHLSGITSEDVAVRAASIVHGEIGRNEQVRKPASARHHRRCRRRMELGNKGLHALHINGTPRCSSEGVSSQVLGKTEKDRNRGRVNVVHLPQYLLSSLVVEDCDMADPNRAAQVDELDFQRRLSQMELRQGSPVRFLPSIYLWQDSHCQRNDDCDACRDRRSSACTFGAP